MSNTLVAIRKLTNMGLSTLYLKSAGKPAEVEDGAHAHVVEGVESVQEFGPRAVETAKPVQALEKPLELVDLRSELLADVALQVVRIHAAPVRHAVAEPGVDECDAELLRHEQDVVIHGRDARGDGDVERNRRTVVLRHIGGNRVAAHVRLGFEHAEVEPVGMPMQRPRGS